MSFPEDRARTEPIAPAAVVQEVSLPASLRTTGLRRIDYCDAHLISGHAARAELSPEHWAREILEQAPAPLRRRLVRVWRVIGLRHGSIHSPEHVLGWPIRENTAHRIVLGAQSWFGMPAQLVLAREADAWIFATLVQHDNAIVSRLWSMITDRHLRAVRYLLQSAATRVALTPQSLR